MGRAIVMLNMRLTTTEKIEEMNVLRAIQNYAVLGALYLLKRVLPFVVGLSLLGGLSVLFTGGFSFTLLSERIFYVALLVFLTGGTVAMAQMVSGKALLFPYNIRKPEDAKKFVEQMPIARETGEKRLDVGIQLWLIGLGVLAISALIQELLT